MIVKINKRRPDGTWISQCVVIYGKAYNITGWSGGLRKTRAVEKPNGQPFASMMLRTQQGIPRTAVVLENNDIVTIDNHQWMLKVKHPKKERQFTWLQKQ